MNINRLLQNAVRTDLIGRNMTTNGRKDDDLQRVKQQDHSGDPYAQNWPVVAPGMPGQLAIGHHLDIVDTVRYRLCDADTGLEFAWTPTRHCWTPAWIDTHYVSQPEADHFPDSGTLFMHETKCILMENDVFVAEITLQNMRREPRTVCCRLECAFSMDETGCAGVEARVKPKSLYANLWVKGYAVLLSDGGGTSLTRQLAPFGKTSFRVAFAFDPHCAEAARRKAGDALSMPGFSAANEAFFNTWINENAPRFTCEDIDLVRLYYYRWFLIFRNAFCPSEVIPGHFIQTPCLYESPFGDWFGAPIGLSVPLQVEESSWMRQSALGRVHIGQWVSGCGSYRGYIQYTPYAVWRFYLNHPDVEWLRAIYPAILEYALNKVKKGLPITDGSWPTGAEYQPSFYQHTQPAWNWHEDNEGVRKGLAENVRWLYRLDEAAYAIANIRACRHMALELGLSDDSSMLLEKEHALLNELEQRHWNEQLQMYVDVDFQTGKQCDQALCYDSFAPFAYGLIREKHESSFAKLFDDSFFMEQFSSATVDKHCPMYWPGNCLTGPFDSSTQHPHYYDCSWNGPVWPYACTLVTEALGAIAREHSDLRRKWLSYFDSWSELHYLYGNRSLPCIVEHYRGTDGKAFRPFSDYFHSSWLTPFFSYWAGIYVKNGEPVFDPFTDMDFELDGLIIGGKEYRLIHQNGVKTILQLHPHQTTVAGSVR